MKHGQHDVPWCLVSTLSLRAVKGAQTKYKQKTMERATLSALVMAHDFVSPRFICRKRGNMNRDYCSEITQTSLFYRFRLSPTRDNTKLQFSKVDWQNSTLCRPKPPQKKTYKNITLPVFLRQNGKRWQTMVSWRISLGVLESLGN